MRDVRSDQPQLFLVAGELTGSGEHPGSEARPLRSRTMRVSDLSRWSRQQLASIVATRNQAVSDELFLYQQAAKLVEEVGELHAELLGRSCAQRADKGAFTEQSLAEECADVAITLVILSEVLGVDLPAALTAKMRKVDARSRVGVNRRSNP